MAQQSILDKVREWIGGVAWSIFLWSARMTEEEYFAELDRVAEQRNEAEADTTDAELCDCGEPFPKSGYCKFCGARQRHLS